MMIINRDTIIDYIKYFFVRGDKRTLEAKKNIFFSSIIRGLNVFINFLLVPITLNYLDGTRYGLWLTLSSIIAWFGLLNLGLGNGLRNKLTEAITLKDFKLARTYVSTTYVMLITIISIFYLLFLFVNPYLNWSKILNCNVELAKELSTVAVIVFTFFSIRFVLNLITVVVTSDQKPAVEHFLNFLGALISLIIIYFITKFSKGNLIYISFIYSAAPVFILLIATFYLFRKRYRFLTPNFRYVRFDLFKSITSLSVKFFILQISVLVIFSTDNFIIIQLFSPDQVTPYNIAYKYFGIVSLGFSILISPFWSAITNAITLDDYEWIKRNIQKLIKVWIILIFVVGFFIIISKKFYHFWVGDGILIPLSLTVLMGLYTIISTWNMIFANFLNGVGKIKLQMYLSILMMIVNIPISIFFARNLNMGIGGVILGTSITLFPASILGSIQYTKIIKKNDQGIWSQ
jgi:O-antigen/teichoic acid export membrane protein